MTEATFFEKKPFSPTSMALIVALHAAAIIPAMLWTMDAIPRQSIKTIVDMIPLTDPPPPDTPRQETKAKEQPDIIQRTNPIVPINNTTNERNDIPTLDGPDIPDLVEPPRPIDPPPPPRMSEAARAKGDVRTLFTSDDYPESARRAEDTGTVQARLEIGTNGKVTGCSIVASSGSAALDRATCKVLQQRARFTPAKDDAGQSVGDSYTTPKIVWRIEGSG